MNMLEKIAVKAPVHGDIVPVAWQRLINTRRKMINVNWKDDDVKTIDDNFDDDDHGIKTSTERVSLIDQKTDETYRAIRRDFRGMSTNQKPDNSSPMFDEMSKRETSVFKIFRSKNSNNVDTKPSSASRVSSSPEEASFRFKPVLIGSYRIPKLTTPGSSSSSYSVTTSSSSTDNTPLTIKPSPTGLKYPRLGLQSRQRSQSSGSAIKFDNFFDREMKQGDQAEDDKQDSRLAADDNPSRNELLGKIRREIKKHDM